MFLKSIAFAKSIVAPKINVLLAAKPSPFKSGFLWNKKACLTPRDNDDDDQKPTDPEDNLTQVPDSTDQAVIVYDQAGDGEPDTFVRLSVDDVADPADLDSYIAAADARLADQDIEADLLKVVFEDAEGTVIQVLYRTEDGGWSETDPALTAEDLMVEMSDEELEALIAEADAAEDDSLAEAA